MAMIRTPADIPPSEITPESVYRARRQFLQAGAAVVGAGLLSRLAPAQAQTGRFSDAARSPFSTDETATEFKDVTTYNNFYEFGVGKGDPAKNAHSLKTSPWSVEVAGECAKPGRYNLEDVLRPHPFEERIYRLRCVEGWSMVIPWVGFPLADLIKRFEPTGNAKYVEFETLQDPEQMPGQRRAILKWPYVEGLRMDEAMHPLTILAVGLYGDVLPNQNGAPLRLVVPWKYGFKSIKSIVKISFVEQQPISAWMRAAPNEYGFYSNVNPDVDHPRWSQRTERRIGEFLKRKTLPFNGYADQVAALYTGMDLRKNF
ncbi:MAG: protein-methionine-sulfoxide reductase catalytic subunit MsrP [Thiohalobacteraceae bacterium]